MESKLNLGMGLKGLKTWVKSRNGYTIHDTIWKRAEGRN